MTRLLLLLPLLALGFVACDDRDDDDNDPRSTGTSEIGGRLRELANDVADRLDDAADEVDDLSREQSDNLQRRCDELADESSEEDVRDLLGSLCGQLVNAIRDADGDTLERLADALRDFAEED